MIDLLVEPMTYDFMLRALLVVSASGVAGALLSCWLVHMRWSLMGDAVSHAVIIVSDLDAEVKGQGGDPERQLGLEPGRGGLAVQPHRTGHARESGRARRRFSA